MNKATLLVLAAGMGSRYGGLKQMDALGPNGESLLEYTVFDAIRCGFDKVVYVIRESFAEEFAKEIGSKFADKIETAYVFQEMAPEIPGLGKVERKKPWGTAHAVLVAEHEIEGPFAVVNADDFYGREGIEKSAKFLLEDVAEDVYAMVGYRLKNTISEHGFVSRGVCVTNDNRQLIGIDERTKVQKQGEGIVYFKGENAHSLPEDAVVSMNLWAFHQNIFPILKRRFLEFAKENQDDPKSEFFIPLIVDELIKAEKIQVPVIPCDAQWYGVTYAEDKSMVQNGLSALTEAGEYPNPLG